MAKLNSCLDQNFWVQLRPFAKTFCLDFCLSETWPTPIVSRVDKYDDDSDEDGDDSIGVVC